MQTYKALVGAVDFKGLDEGDAQLDTHCRIYDHLTTSILRDPALADKHPPPAAFFYAIRNILYPTFIIGQIPDILQLLCDVETIRQQALSKASQASELNTERGTGRLLLSEQKKERLSRMVLDNEEDRKLYVALICNLCETHIYHLWTAPESRVLPRRMNDYFPGCISDIQTESVMHFHLHLSDAEKQTVDKIKDRCIGWLKIAGNWEEAREMDCVDRGISIQEMDATLKRDFDAEFTPPICQDNLIAALEKYMSKIERMITRLHSYFPRPSSS
ncbi:hypothetical protein BJ138DRAFT_80513 [Hygrophoropsis aurantiaca]|uniref:Uncharacterized protein n=1 Tax=Hygrophoropsis aurantiaca TaxID=72124 RepID=A0ACB8ABH1_9AGAM|nr:hypothetical protein BJ138DRAFT_80513 [Hygrophoropsis aurantiaca]